MNALLMILKVSIEKKYASGMYSLEFAIKFLSNRIANFQKNVTSQMLYKVPEKSQNTIQIVEYIFLHKQ